jgi:type IV pilus assembly protein PilC
LIFGYRVRDEQGRLKSGTWEADHKNTVVAGLLCQNYYIVSLKELQSNQSFGHVEINLQSFKQVSGQDLVFFTRQLSIMLAAGLPILRCLKVLAEQTVNPKLKKVVLTIQEDIESGLPLWEAFGRHSHIFSSVYINMLKAGETAGVLDTVLNKLSYHLEKEQKFKAKLKSASIYPLFISVLAVVVVILIITLIMPSFVSIFESSGVQLPLPTRLLLGVSTFLKINGPLILIGFLSLILLIRWVKGTTRGRFIYDRILVHLPIFGKSIIRIAEARFARTLGILIRSGINVLQALEVVEEVVGNAVIGRAISGACRSIKEGDSITSPLQRSGLFEPLVTHMIAVGEETGRLDEILIHLSEYYEDELIHMLDNLVAIIEPLLILLVALVVGGVVIAILYPMFDMINLVGV